MGRDDAVPNSLARVINKLRNIYNSKKPLDGTSFFFGDYKKSTY